jgi:hypothetical protein
MNMMTTANPPYDFKTQLSRGLKGESIIREHFCPKWEIITTSREFQKIGIDFIFKSRENGDSYRIEVKSDSTASQTNNAFIELYSVFPDKKGWAYTCQADYLFYFLPLDRIIYSFKPFKLKKLIPEWRKYPTRNIPNKGYESKGILVPLRELEKHSSIINM